MLERQGDQHRDEHRDHGRDDMLAVAGWQEHNAAPREVSDSVHGQSHHGRHQGKFFCQTNSRTLANIQFHYNLCPRYRLGFVYRFSF